MAVSAQFVSREHRVSELAQPRRGRRPVRPKLLKDVVRQKPVPPALDEAEDSHDVPPVEAIASRRSPPPGPCTTSGAAGNPLVSAGRADRHTIRADRGVAGATGVPAQRTRPRHTRMPGVGALPREASRADIANRNHRVAVLHTRGHDYSVAARCGRHSARAARKARRIVLVMAARPSEEGTASLPKRGEGKRNLVRGTLNSEPVNHRANVRSRSSTARESAAGP